MNETSFDLMRHAKTHWNFEGKVMGKTDLPLAPEGKQQVKQWMVGFHGETECWDKILSSPLLRCLETATLLNQSLNLPVFKDSRLQEQDWGRWAGKTFREIRNQEKNMLEAEAEKGWEFSPPDGESRRCVLSRSLSALKTAASKWRGQHILVVTHEGVIRSIVYHLIGRDFIMSEPKIIKPYHLHRISWDSQGPHMVSLNAISLDPPNHLKLST
jgi:probable phosphoglycerate mutase